jgi:dTDP-4-dehydrorhamnose 3,5-epimerase
MNIIETSLPGVLVIEPRFFDDPRGFFLETWSKQRYRDLGIQEEFVQDNASFSSKGTLRGLHFQHPRGQGKLVQVLHGAVFDVVVDIRKDASSFGQWFGLELTADRHNQMYIPPGYAHGFLVLSDIALFTYKCTDYYHPDTEGGILWNDPDIGIQWPFEEPLNLSERDAANKPLSQIATDKLPTVGDYT